MSKHSKDFVEELEEVKDKLKAIFNSVGSADLIPYKYTHVFSEVLEIMIVISNYYLILFYIVSYYLMFRLIVLF